MILDERETALQDCLIERTDEEECLATFWSQATPGSAYVRLTLPARYLPGQVLQLLNTDLTDWDEDEQVLTMPRQRGAAIWQFAGNEERALIAAAQQLTGWRVLVEVDDNYLVPAPDRHSPWRKTVEQAKDAFGYSHEAHKRTIGFVDGVITSTPYLRDVYAQLHENVYLCPNCVDPGDWQYERPEPDGILRIVYYGSPYHMRDAPLLTKALKWAARQPDVEVYLMGVDMPWGFAEKVPFKHSLPEVRESLFQFDIGLAPLIDDRWSRCKSDVKALEYAMAGVMPLVQDVESYSEWGDLRVTDWEEAIRYWVKNRDEIALTAEAAKQYVLAERTIQTNLDPWKEAIGA